MGWDDVVIGKGERGNTAVICGDLGPCEKHGISENGVSYWISRCILDLECTIFKDTKEGKKITEMRKEGRPVHQIQDFIDIIVIKKAKFKDIKNKIEEMKKDCFRKGKEEKNAEIKKVLGIEDY